MKKVSNRFEGIITKVVSIALVFAIVIAFANPMTASAKVKKMTLKNADFREDLTNEVDAVAKTVKSGQYKFKIKGKKMTNYVCLKFTAPKSKEYTFKFSKLKPSGEFACGHYSVNKIDPAFPQYFLDSQNHFVTSKVVSDGYKKTGSDKIYLNEGESAYIIFTLTKLRSKSMTFNFKIK
ncbi:hypothetical protein [Ruminococcus sp.]|uniref:hypothetical protein n=1 Tax=Ruminococcus sp. TaxID=41978 RepID=UPI0025F83F4B|nr:hypothetical protein [Ruminococcus sp.]